MKWIYVAIVVVVVLAIIYYLTQINRRERTRDDNYNKSNGTFDEWAKKALEDTAVKKPTPKDRLTRGKILAYNVLEGGEKQDDDLAQETTREYTGAVADPQITMLDLHHIEDWYTAYQGDIALGLLMDADGGADLDDLLDMHDQLPGLGHAPIDALLFGIVHAAPVAVNNDIEKRTAEAAKEATKIDAVDTFLAPEYVNDAQSVHDSAAVRDMNDILAKYKRENYHAEVNAGLADSKIRRWIKKSTISDAAKNKAVTALNKMTENSFISTYNAREEDILDVVWDRCHHPVNKDNEENCKEAVALALADSIDENGNSICIGGRAARIINSLASIDGSGETGALTFPAYKNQIFDETKKIIEDKLATYEGRGGDDGEFAAKYKEGKDTDKTIEARFNDEAKKAIDENISTYKNLSDMDKELIKKECHAALMV